MSLLFIYLFFSLELLSLSISEIVVTFEAISIGIWAILSWFSQTAFENRCGAVERVMGAHMDFGGSSSVNKT